MSNVRNIEDLKFMVKVLRGWGDQAERAAGNCDDMQSSEVLAKQSEACNLVREMAADALNAVILSNENELRRTLMHYEQWDFSCTVKRVDGEMTFSEIDVQRPTNIKYLPAENDTFDRFITDLKEFIAATTEKHSILNVEDGILFSWDTKAGEICLSEAPEIDDAPVPGM